MVSPLSIAEKNLWTKRLLCQWMDGAQQALIDSVGYDRALELLKPHAINTGVAGTQFAMNRLGIKGNRVEDILIVFKFTHLGMGREDSRIRMGDLGGYIDFFSCPFERCSRLYCTFFCDMAGSSGASLVGPDYDWHLARSLCYGDEYCRKGLVLKGHTFVDMKRDEMRIVEPPPFPVGEEELAWFSRAYYGEFWTIFTRCLIEVADGPGAVELMRPHMLQSGLSFALEAREALGPTAGDPDGLRMTIELLFDLLGIKAEWNGPRCEWTISECPFSNAEVEIGDQLNILMNAIAEGLDDHSKVRCERRKCGGDGCCTIKMDQGGRSLK